MAFDLAFNAYSNNNEPIKRILDAINDQYENSFNYKPGRSFESYFEEKGYTPKNLDKMTSEEKEKFGIELLKIALRRGNRLFE